MLVADTKDIRLNRFLTSLEPRCNAKLGEGQRAAIAAAFARSFPVARQSDMRFGFGSWYVRIMTGPERRSATRRILDMRLHPQLTRENLPLVILIALVSLSAATILAGIIPPLMVKLFF